MPEPLDTRPRAETADASSATGPQVLVLGGGPCGLAHALYARRAGLSVQVLEAETRIGGNCKTFRGPWGLAYDSGAHRLHDRDARATAEMRGLLGDALLSVDVPSRVHQAGRELHFPLTATELWHHLGTPGSVLAGLDLIGQRLFFEDDGSFEAFARRAYGRRVAERFLLGYSFKLWGRSPRRLSPVVAGGRMAGLDLRTLLGHLLPGTTERTPHLEGAFLYPRHGIGQAMDAMAEASGPGVIRCGARVVAVHHDHRRVLAVTLDGGLDMQAPGLVVSTLPLPDLVRLLRPRMPEGLVRLSSSLGFRHLRLVALFLDRPAVLSAATLYFPDRGVPFTRVYEPRIRSAAMAPEGRTTLVVEFPCHEGTTAFTVGEGHLVEQVVRTLGTRLGLFLPREVIGHEVRILPHAYPVLDRGCEARVAELRRTLASLGNLRLCGRNGRFEYSWIHDQLRQGYETIRDYLDGDRT